ncbi:MULTISPECIES: D-2-hydroxyacid dehydrogenase [Sphingomonas]|uniref:D-2-hydroxyacid dehydrogenase n=1 Tax=Sphingomonas molluscorum TaxID=418184 RepID=A0ABU8Q2K8_9SPHN|nr:D-2-hydroxyacid dehydrogenase [Sphingomonas sp. JUb134]MBM7405239.1 glycerate dehydrogenase [Sphingomonas sp. JUb134]
MQKIVFLDRETIAPDVTMRPPALEHEWIEHPHTPPGLVRDRLAGATIAITNKVSLDADTLAQLPDLRMIAIAATGTDNVDLDYCSAHGIVVSNIRGYATATVPEHCFALILALRRSLIGYREAVRDGRWQQSGNFCFFDYPIANLQGQTIGIIGEGALGQAVGHLAEAFGMQVLYAAHKGRNDMGDPFTPFDEVLARSDVLTLHCPLIEATRNLLSDREFGLMQRHPIVINTARGGLIDEQALVRAITEGLIAGAGIDVCAVEPPPADHPYMALLDRPNFILTPHIAWAGHQAIQYLADQVIDNIEAYEAGAPANLVSSPP